MSCIKPNCNCPQIYADRMEQDVDQLKHGYPCLQSDHDPMKLKQVPDNSAPSENTEIQLAESFIGKLSELIGEAPKEETKGDFESADAFFKSRFSSVYFEDKHEKKIQRFDYYDMVDFAEQYAKTKGL